MASFGNEFQFCEVNKNQFLGVSRGRNPNELLVTKSRTCAILYEIEGRKSTLSFNTWRGRRLQTAVVYCQKQQRFVGALGNLSLQVWTQDETNIGKEKIITVPYEVAALWVVNDVTDPLIVYKNGSVAQLTGGNSLNMIVEQNDDDVKLIRVTEFNDKVHIVFVSKKGEAVLCCYLRLNQGEMYTLDTQILSNLSDCEMPDDLSLNPIQNVIEILLLKHDGTLALGSLASSNKEIKWSQKEIGAAKAIAVLDGYLIGAHVQENEVVCSVYNMKYETETSQKIIKTVTEPDHIELYVIQSKLYLRTRKALYCLPFVTVPLELASFVGLQEKLKTVEVWIWDSHKLLKAENILPEKPYEENIYAKKSCLEVFSELIQKNELKMIDDALKHYDNIPEKVVVDLLSFCLGVIKDGKIENAKKSEISRLNNILSVPINDIHLREHLHTLSSETVIVLLHYLHSLVKDFSCVNNGDWQITANIVDWLNVLLDCQFNMLRLMDDSTYALLLELRETVLAHCQRLAELAKLQHLIAINKSSLADSQTDKIVYCIETFHIPE